MHYTALYAMSEFVNKYLDKNKKLKILEIGSYDGANPKKDLVFRRYFRDNPNWEFIGMDIVEGRNVDVISSSLYRYPFEDNSFDVVISGNTMEHVKDIYAWIKELTRITNDLLYIIVPAYRPEHRHPVDCWRVYPDGMRFIMEEIAKLKVLECRLYGSKVEDTIGVGKKYV